MKKFITDNFDERIQEAFNSLKVGAAKADLWRYLNANPNHRWPPELMG